MRIAMFPGSFDPPTNGHIDIIERASRLFDSIYVVVSENISKSTMFTAEERRKMLEECVSPFDNVKVFVHSGLTVDFALAHGVSVMLRGVRNSSDCSFELELAMNNRLITSKVETLFFPSDPKQFLVRSSSVKEMAAFGIDVSSLVPENVNSLMLEKLGKEGIRK